MSLLDLMTAICLPVSFSARIRRRSVVVLPENIGPTTTCISPGDEESGWGDDDDVIAVAFVCSFLVEMAEGGEFVEDLLLIEMVEVVREEKRRAVEKREGLGR